MLEKIALSKNNLVKTLIGSNNLLVNKLNSYRRLINGKNVSSEEFTSLIKQADLFCSYTADSLIELLNTFLHFALIMWIDEELQKKITISSWLDIANTHREIAVLMSSNKLYTNKLAPTYILLLALKQDKICEALLTTINPDQLSGKDIAYLATKYTGNTVTQWLQPNHSLKVKWDAYQKLLSSDFLTEQEICENLYASDLASNSNELHRYLSYQHKRCAIIVWNHLDLHKKIQDHHWFFIGWKHEEIAMLVCESKDLLIKNEFAIISLCEYQKKACLFILNHGGFDKLFSGSNLVDFIKKHGNDILEIILSRTALSTTLLAHQLITNLQSHHSVKKSSITLEKKHEEDGSTSLKLGEYYLLQKNTSLARACFNKALEYGNAKSLFYLVPIAKECNDLPLLKQYIHYYEKKNGSFYDQPEAVKLCHYLSSKTNDADIFYKLAYYKEQGFDIKEKTASLCERALDREAPEKLLNMVYKRITEIPESKNTDGSTNVDFIANIVSQDPAIKFMENIAKDHADTPSVVTTRLYHALWYFYLNIPLITKAWNACHRFLTLSESIPTNITIDWIEVAFLSNAIIASQQEEKESNLSESSHYYQRVFTFINYLTRGKRGSNDDTALVHQSIESLLGETLFYYSTSKDKKDFGKQILSIPNIKKFLSVKSKECLLKITDADSSLINKDFLDTISSSKTSIHTPTISICGLNLAQKWQEKESKNSTIGRMRLTLFSKLKESSTSPTTQLTSKAQLHRNHQKHTKK